MFNETKLTDINNKSLDKHIFKASENQNSNTFHSSYSFLDDGGYRNILNQAVEELCNLYDEEEMKGNYAASVLNLMDKFLASRQLKPEELINWYVNNSSPFSLGSYVSTFHEMTL
ncbi:1175_t:CDS:2 [Scutellospora calospora]|uniref:1175_t:CDS:1 n=1 Tax=Scutellospora calospora TaxID=85575 RepID=A0ACA9LC84_9GLOM|nr:1175_t:CDS:2 [Scutellospora calospora]